MPDMDTPHTLMPDLIERITINRDRIEIRPSESLRQFMSGEIFFEYPGYDLADLPEEIAVLPFVWSTAGIVWAIGAEYDVPALPEETIASLERVRSVVREIYPQSAWLGEIRARAGVSLPPRDARFGRGIMFTGGVDSTFTALSNAGRDTLLISVWGADVELSERTRWQRWMRDAQAFAREHAGGLASIRTNLREELNYIRLNSIVPGLQRWWLDVQFSMSLTGAAAPIAYMDGFESIYFASGLDIGDDQNYPHASFPRLDNAIAHGRARVRHHGNDTKRQQKLAFIVSQVPEMELRVCHARRPETQLNCGRCTKCVRTMVGLVICGADPTRYGFPTYQPAMLDELPRRFAAYEIPFRTHEIQLWRDMQEAAEAGAVENEDFVHWLKGMDFDEYQRSQPRRAVRSRALGRRLVARVPALRGTLRRVTSVGHLKRRLP